MPVFQTLKDTLSSYNNLTSNEISLICQHFTPLQIRNYEHFQFANQPVGRIGFILKGIFRGYIVDETKEETIKFFLQTNQFIVDVQGLQGLGDSYLSLQAIKPSKILTISVEDVRELSQQIPALDKIIDMLCIKTLLSINRINDAFQKGPSMQKYLRFLKLYPNIANQIPLKYIALFLDITPQSFSRIRREIF
jgi:CRP-like cAMP-binding protein